MTRYRLVFPPLPGKPADHPPTAYVNTGETIYEVGDVIEHHGKQWRVTQAPVEQPANGEDADLMVWPVDQ